MCLYFKDIRRQNFPQKEKGFDNAYDQTLGQSPRTSTVPGNTLNLTGHSPAQPHVAGLALTRSCVRSPPEVPPRLGGSRCRGTSGNFTHLHTSLQGKGAYGPATCPSVRSFCPSPLAFSHDNLVSFPLSPSPAHPKVLNHLITPKPRLLLQFHFSFSDVLTT